LPGLGDESRDLSKVIPLRRLLGAVTGLMLGGAASFLLWGLSTGATRGAAGLFLLVLVLGVAVAALLVRDDASVEELRWIERAVFAAVTAYFAWTAYTGLGELLVAGDVAGLASRWNLVLVQFVLLMVAYGTAVPNAWSRAARVIGALALTPAAVATLLWLASPQYAVGMNEAATPGRVAQSAIVLASAALLGMMAAYVIDQYLALARTTRVTLMYVLKHRIGQGGMGEVWLGEHNLLARPAAIKLIRGDAVDSQDADKAALVLRRFEREAQATASLRSIHTVEVYDFGVADDGTFYYAMEYLDGIDLSTLVKRHGPVAAERVVYLLEQACQSLADAHDQRMTHRDIKPANIFICRLGTARDFVKVLDFGLVTSGALPALGAEQATELTLEGEINGTPGYMAPELVLDGVAADGRADLYALGCVGYYMLTGAPVFEGPPLSVLVDHVKTPPVPPSERVEMEIPAGLERVILTCLEKDPGARYQSAAELAEALLASCPEPPWDARRADNWWGLHLPPAAI